MLDINGQDLRGGALASLLCQVVSIEGGQVLVRVLNSDLEIAIGVSHDEVLGGLVADSELTAFVEISSETAASRVQAQPEADGVAIQGFE